MATIDNYNDEVIAKLREGFTPVRRNSREYNDKFPFTNCALIFAYNGTGKTRLSYDFAHYGRTKPRAKKHTLYYNAYTEDIFTWKNDLDNNEENILLINQDSEFVQGLGGVDFTVRLRNYLQLFTDIDFDFDYVENDPTAPPCSVRFNKKKTYEVELNGQTQNIEEVYENIKISRGEERLFVWCFFRCIMDEVVNGNPAYKDIEYIYIDDPMSSLDDNNVILFAQQLYSLIRKQRDDEVAAYRKGKCRRIKFVISTHHALFFHTMLHGLNADRKLQTYYLSRDKVDDVPVLKDMSSDTPFYYNVAMMSEIQRAIYTNNLYTYHFNIIRSVMEKIAEFFGHFDFRFILHGIDYKKQKFNADLFDDAEMKDLYTRIVNVYSHQGSFFAPAPMVDDNKEMLIQLFYHIKKTYHFILPNLTDDRSELQIFIDKKQKNNR